MFDYNALQLRNKVITVNTVCYSIFLYQQQKKKKFRSPDQFCEMIILIPFFDLLEFDFIIIKTDSTNNLIGIELGTTFDFPLL